MVDKEFICTECNKDYSSYFSLWRHKKTIHKILDDIDTNNICKYCNKELADRKSRWRHETKTCKKNPILEKKITNINVSKNTNSNINVIQNQTNHITINFNTLGNENVLDLTEKQKEEIINDGIDGIITIIKHLNFNKDLPQNHLFCTTNLNNKYVLCEIQNKQSLF